MATISKVVEVINNLTSKSSNYTVGIGMPGSIHPETNLVQVSNTKALEGKPVKLDIEKKLGYKIKIANDADCLALSEAVDGAGKDYKSVFAVILGTGVGAGYSYERIARSFSTFVNILDPDIIVCGGGMSEIDGIYDEVPKRIIPYIASNFFLTPIVSATHGSSSGVRGAAHLWN